MVFEIGTTYERVTRYVKEATRYLKFFDRFISDFDKTHYVLCWFGLLQRHTGQRRCEDIGHTLGAVDDNNL